MDDPFANLSGDPNPTSQIPKDPFAPLTQESLARRRHRRKMIALFSSAGVVVAVFAVMFLSSSDDSISEVPVAIELQQGQPQKVEPQQEQPSVQDLEPVETENYSSSPGPSSLFVAPRDIEALIDRVQTATFELWCLPDPSTDIVDFGSAFIADVSDLTGSPQQQVVLLTNYHVIEACALGGVIGISREGEDLPVEIVDVDPENDLAVLQGLDITAAPLPISTEVRVGQWVMATGNPQGISQAVTFGQVTGRDSDDNWIAADALVGPGNSGGPLVNGRGEVIGVVGARYIEVTGLSATVPVDLLCARVLNCR